MTQQRDQTATRRPLFPCHVNEVAGSKSLARPTRLTSVYVQHPRTRGRGREPPHRMLTNLGGAPMQGHTPTEASLIAYGRIKNQQRGR